MSKLNINKTEWLELVFEGKNKEYGAYKMRQEDGSTTIKAFFSALALLTGLALIPVILSSFTDKPKVIEEPKDHGPLIVTEVRLPKKEEQKKIEEQIKKAEVVKEPETKDLVNITVVKPEEATLTEITKNENLGKNTSEDPLAAYGSPTGSTTGTTIEPVKETPSKGNGEMIANPSMVEKNPMFPGGVEAFLRIVGNRFSAPDMEEEKALRVIVFFVVEKDGSLSNITVPRSPGFGLDKEAIRVLKSIKTKWEPGIYKGEPVRTSYSLPIVVKAN